MRILHTSDWHFGKRFLETDMIPQQELFADWIADQLPDYIGNMP